jgi:hypothetical protein
MIDASIYSQIKQPQAPDVGESLGKAMTLRGLADQNQANQMKIEAEKKSAYTKQAIPVFEYLQTLPEEKLQVEYPKYMQQLAQAGMPTTNLIKDQNGMPIFDKQLFGMQVQGVSQTPEYRAMMKEKLDQQKTTAEIANLTEKANPMVKGLEIKKLQAEIRKIEAEAGKARSENLPPENKEQINKLAGSNASKMAIVKQIDSDAKILDDPNVSEDQKLIKARQMIKTLNSTQGQDAVGAEEAKRLAGLLEFNILNLTNPGPVFGRAPVAEFSKQAKFTSKSLKDAINSTQGVISELKTGRPLNAESESSSSIMNAGGKNIKPPNGDYVIQNGYKYDWNAKTGRYE